MLLCLFSCWGILLVELKEATNAIHLRFLFLKIMKRNLIIALFFTLAVSAAKAQSDSALKDVGVAVSPSHINFNLKPGESKTFEVKVTNETQLKRSFSIVLNDYDVDQAGKTAFAEAGKSKYGISQWLTIAPTFFEVAPGGFQKIKVTLSIPDTGFSNRAGWCLMMVEERKKRETIDNKGGDKKISLGVIPTFAFGVYIYQNPPTVQNNKVEIKNFVSSLPANKKTRNIEFALENVGDGIAFCIAYVELTNLKTGKQQKLMVKRFTILPGNKRNYLFPLPENLEPGKYSAVGVLDFGSNDEV
jgi:hypothetical protein